MLPARHIAPVAKSETTADLPSADEAHPSRACRTPRPAPLRLPQSLITAASPATFPQPTQASLQQDEPQPLPMFLDPAMRAVSSARAPQSPTERVRERL